MSQITIIAAAGTNNELGTEGDLPWHLPDDFKRFKKLTSGHPIIMGRKTFETFPKPLKDRLHIVVTRDKGYSIASEECIVVHSLEEAILRVSHKSLLFIIGGGEIYKQAMPFATCIELTRIHGTFNADTHFPEIDPTRWRLTAEVHHPEDEKHKFAFTYQTYLEVAKIQER